MRRSNLIQRVYLGLAVTTLAFVVSGCGESTLPETPAGASRSQMDNPFGDSKKAAEKPAEKPAKVSPKMKAALENAAKADPRGK